MRRSDAPAGLVNEGFQPPFERSAHSVRSAIGHGRGTGYVAALVLAVATGYAAGGPKPEAGDATPPAGDPIRGRALIRSFGCGACHVIPGIPEADGIVGPPLDRMAERAYLAGVLANTHEDMMRWLRDPPAVDPATAMPKVEMSEDQARHIAAYLYTLR